MKTVSNYLLFPLLLVSMILVMAVGFVIERDSSQAIAQSNPLTLGEAAPDLAVSAEGPTVHLAWTEVLGAKGYRLLFSFRYGETVDDFYEIDMGDDTALLLNFGSDEILDLFENLGSLATVEEGLAFHVRVEAYDHEGGSRQSNVEHVSVGANEYQFQGEDTVGDGEQPSSISARLSCIPFVEPARSYISILGGIAMFVPVGGTNPFTASGGTGGFTCIPGDPSIGTSGFTSPASGLGWITGVSVGSTVINIWNAEGCLTPMSVQVVPAGSHYIYLANLSPSPYPYGNLVAGVPVMISSLFNFPLLPGEKYGIRYSGYLGRFGSADVANSDVNAQVAFGETLRRESGINSTRASQSYQMDITVTLPYGFDYLVIWAELTTYDFTMVLAQSAQTGWLINQ